MKGNATIAFPIILNGLSLNRCLLLHPVYTLKNQQRMEQHNPSLSRRDFHNLIWMVLFESDPKKAYKVFMRFQLM